MESRWRQNSALDGTLLHRTFHYLLLAGYFLINVEKGHKTANHHHHHHHHNHHNEQTEKGLQSISIKAGSSELKR